MARFVGIGGDTFVNPEHVTSVTANDDGDTVVGLTNSTAVTTDLLVGEVVDRLEADDRVTS